MSFTSFRGSVVPARSSAGLAADRTSTFVCDAGEQQISRDFFTIVAQPLRLRVSHDPLGALDTAKSVAEPQERGEPRRCFFRHASGAAQALQRLHFSLELAIFCLGQHCCPIADRKARASGFGGSCAKRSAAGTRARRTAARASSLGRHVAEDMRHKGCLLDRTARPCRRKPCRRTAHSCAGRSCVTARKTGCLSGQGEECG